MKNIYVGACGWEYFPVKYHKLREYSKLFDVVEVNSTFYRLPSLRIVENWRKIVKKDFIFTVKAHKDISHIHKFKLKREAVEKFEKLVDICKILKAEIIVLQVPYRQRPSSRFLKNLVKFLDYAQSYEVNIGVEARGPDWRNRRSRLILKNVISKFNATHVFDASYEEPVFHTNIVYSRIYGKGYHTLWVLDDEEVKQIVDLAKRYAEENKVYLMGHGCRMYDDAIRIKTYIEDNYFLPIYPVKGLAAVRMAILENPKFPASKKELIKLHGWKVVDTENKRIRMSKILEKIDDRVYRSLNDLLKEILCKKDLPS